MATLAPSDIEETARQTRALIRYVDPGDFLTRRYVSQGQELNTGTYSDHEVIAARRHADARSLHARHTRLRDGQMPHCNRGFSRQSRRRRAV